MTINLAWPRGAVYGTDHWYFQYGAFVFVGAISIIGGLYYGLVQRRKPSDVLAEHRADALGAPGAGTVWRSRGRVTRKFLSVTVPRVRPHHGAGLSARPELWPPRATVANPKL